jgi:hypothetical protein
VITALAALTLLAPVPGDVARGFAYRAQAPFVAGAHRGADFAAAPGAAVRATCTGRVAWAHGDVVTLRCGGWRVTHLPLATITVRRGTRVAAGQGLGTLARSAAHAGLHLGVRYEGDRFAYIDPVPLLGERRPAPPPAAARPRLAPRPPVRPRSAPRPGVRPRSAPGPPPLRFAPAGARVRVLAPWPAWLGLGVLLLGVAGGGVRVGVRRRRAAHAVRARVPVA